MTKFFDLVIVGAGVAGLSALMATERHLRVAVVNPGPRWKPGVPGGPREEWRLL